MYVQFTDASQTAISAVFSCEQNHEDWPNQGQIEKDDPRYLAFIEPYPSATHMTNQVEEQEVRDDTF